MDAVTIITGGAGGMGVATATILGAQRRVVLCDVRRDRLEQAAVALRERGIEPTLVEADVTDRSAVRRSFETAASLGSIASVIHTAGVSPSMGDADYVMRTNALGTINVDEVFYESADAGAAIVNVASMAAHLLPPELIPSDRFPLAPRDEAAFVEAMRKTCDAIPPDARPGFAYAVSKSFVAWYTTSQAERFNARGLRIVSVSPGSVDTEMGRLEAEAGAGAMVADFAVPRWGRADEMAELFAFCASDRAGYLTGTDILCDGGVVASMRERARVAGAG
ncbi:oxidoreductase [Mycolicibacterium madagascariense]|uniref:Oxidoreductase n=1 Tax=Mycolicibacterium madagascariense TaxID=212765 RepID=A0A7I7X983_9MYCO|nr:SDR family oxidoreductase [Mycolicibacterium madagascariense]MCV7012737.1 SDR family oxidoreductase [Mycolicibacterium madagascariense]BBZ26002.1 oxidoreductase [Mycolicibacterium madagascariense]